MIIISVLVEFYLSHRGFSFGIDDVSLPENILVEKEELLNEM